MARRDTRGGGRREEPEDRGGGSKGKGKATAMEESEEEEDDDDDDDEEEEEREEASGKGEEDGSEEESEGHEDDEESVVFVEVRMPLSKPRLPKHRLVLKVEKKGGEKKGSKSQGSETKEVGKKRAKRAGRGKGGEEGGKGEGGGQASGSSARSVKQEKGSMVEENRADNAVAKLQRAVEQKSEAGVREALEELKRLCREGEEVDFREATRALLPALEPVWRDDSLRTQAMRLLNLLLEGMGASERKGVQAALGASERKGLQAALGALLGEGEGEEGLLDAACELTCELTRDWPKGMGTQIATGVREVLKKHPGLPGAIKVRSVGRAISDAGRSTRQIDCR